MKFLLIITAILFAATACSDKAKEGILDDPETELVENFRIYGVIEGASEVTMYLEAMSQQGTIAVAECHVDDDGEFEMIGNIPDMGIYQLRLGNDKERIITLPLVPKDNVELTADLEHFQSTPKFTGTEWADPMTEYMKKFTSFIDQQQALAAQQGKIPDDQLMAKYQGLREPIDQFCRTTIEKNPENPINFMLTSFLTPNMGFKDWDPANLQTLEKLSSAYQKRYKKSPIAQNLSQQIDQIKAGYEQFKTMNSGNQLAPEIALNNPSGKQIKLSSLRGNYVLIDFWASWCGPCRAENPNVVRLYNQYKDKGFTVYSVSLDKDMALWTSAIQKDGLIWPNHVSDLQGWETKLVELYGFQGIPYTVLLDKEGHIIATGLRGASLEQKLKELIKK